MKHLQRVAVVRIGGDVDHAAGRGEIHGRRDVHLFEQVGHLADLADEDEAAHARVQLLQRVDELQHQPRDVAHRIGHVAKDEDLRPLRPLAAEDEPRREAAGGEVLSQRAPHRKHAAPAHLALPRQPRLEALGEPAHHGAHALDFGGREGSQVALQET